MSEDEKIMWNSILQGIKKAPRQMLERKAKLGESVVYADANGNPYVLSAAEALKRLNNNTAKP